MKLNNHRTSPVMKPPFKDLPRVDYTKGFDPSRLREGWGMGGYNEKRENMYTAPQYNNERNIHMGVDIWAPAGEPVFAQADGVVAYTANHNEAGNYGATIVLKLVLDSEILFALYGHLSLKSLQQSLPGQLVKSGEMIGWLGSESENGNWHPHLHYQLSFIDPGEADMPGVISESDRKHAIKVYPDPESVVDSLV